MPVRCARWVVRKNWIVTGSDDLVIRVFNYNTTEKVASWEAHSDYIRAFAVHPTRPYLLSSSDDMTVRLWDWERGWKCVTTYEGHQHYVMSVVFNPKDPNTFATASLDRTIKIWSLASPTPNYTLEGHEKGVNGVDYYCGADKPYLVSGSDDHSVRIWDYQTKACVRVLEGHSQNISSVAFHPELPLLLSASEDGTLRAWNSSTFRVEANYSFGMERIWTVCLHPNSIQIAVGCDEGAVVFSLGKSEPAASMDANGKIIWAKGHQIYTGTVRTISEDGTESIIISPSDGESIQIVRKELGNSETYPQLIQHSPTGRFVAVLGDGEYVIYTAVAWRNKSFGKAQDFCWGAPGTNDYAVRDGSGKVTVYQNFTEAGTLPGTSLGDQRLFGGRLVGVWQERQLCLYDWGSLQLVRRIDLDVESGEEPTRLAWSDGGQLAIATSEGGYIVRYHPEALEQQQQESATEDGIEEAIEFVGTISSNGEAIQSGCWVGEAFFLVTRHSHRLAYWIGGESYPVAMCERPMHCLGFLADEGKVFLADKDANVVSYQISLEVIQYETAILEGDPEQVRQLTPKLPTSQLNRVAHFLEAHGHAAEALQLATDPDYRFELAMGLGKLDIAYDLACEWESPAKWRQLGDRALAEWKVALAEKCFVQGADLNSLLLLYASSGNQAGLASLAQMALSQGHPNVALSCFVLGGRREDAFELLLSSKRYPEAALFARAYHLPINLVDRAVLAWREDLVKQDRQRYSEMIPVPSEHPELFPELSFAHAAFDGNTKTSFGGKKAPFEHSFPIPLCNNVTSNDPEDYMSMASMEVNTTGTGSVRAEDVDEMIASMRGTGFESSSFNEHHQPSHFLSPHPEEEDEDYLETAGNPMKNDDTAALEDTLDRLDLDDLAVDPNYPTSQRLGDAYDDLEDEAAAPADSDIKKSLSPVLIPDEIDLDEDEWN